MEHRLIAIVSSPSGYHHDWRCACGDSQQRPDFALTPDRARERWAMHALIHAEIALRVREAAGG